MRATLIFGATVVAVSASAEANANPPVDEQDLAGLSIEELAQIEARSARQV